jgi:hypothetical protein
LPSRPLVLAIVVATGAAAMGVVFAARNLATSQEASGIVDFSKVTPLPFPGYPTDIASSIALDSSKAPTCQAAADERPDPNLPPLSCRSSASEPPPGSIDTPSPAEIPNNATLAANAPAGWTVIDNRIFRYTLALPPGWYSNMRPEGGAFYVFDEIKTEEVLGKGGVTLPGGVAAGFSARRLVTDTVPGFTPNVEEHLATPNADFGGHLGAIWQEGGGEGTAVSVHAAFAREGVVYEMVFDIEDDRAAVAIDADVALSRQILATIQPY